jgi:homoserine kinase type II
MAVYTDVSADDLTRFLSVYDIGELLSYKGIAEGVENSNFLVHAGAGNFILTLYEKRVAEDDLPFFSGAHGASCRARDHLPPAGKKPAGRRSR